MAGRTTFEAALHIMFVYSQRHKVDTIELDVDKPQVVSMASP